MAFYNLDMDKALECLDFSYLDNVPFVIAKKFEAPPKVCVPSEVVNFCPPDLFNENMNYTCVREKSVIEDLNFSHKLRCKSEEARKARLEELKLKRKKEEETRLKNLEKEKEEQKIREKEEKEIQLKIFLEEEEKKMEEFRNARKKSVTNASTGTEESVAITIPEGCSNEVKLAANEFCDTKRDVKNCSLENTNESNSTLTGQKFEDGNKFLDRGVLEPVPVGSSSLNDTNKTSTTGISKNRNLMSSKFNWEDFENDSDPFDKVELNTINDLQELATVLENSKPASNSFPPVTNESFDIFKNPPQNSVKNNSSNSSCPSNFPEQSVNGPASFLPGNNLYSHCQTPTTFSFNYSSQPVFGNYSMALPYQQGNSTKLQPNFTNSSLVQGLSNPCPYLQFRRLGEFPNLKSNIVRTDYTGGVSSSPNMQFNPVSNSTIATSATWPNSLQNTFSQNNHFNNNMNNNLNVVNSQNLSTHRAETDTNQHLFSPFYSSAKNFNSIVTTNQANSIQQNNGNTKYKKDDVSNFYTKYLDMSAIKARPRSLSGSGFGEMSTIKSSKSVGDLRTAVDDEAWNPPEGQNFRGGGRGTVGLEQWQPWPVLDGPTNGPSEEGRVPAQNDASLVTEKMLSKFGTETQSMCKSISEMGFPLDRVVRICSSLGNDSKQVVEHCLHAQNLDELGFEPLDVEHALLLHNNNESKAKEYLQLLNQFLDLGFSKEKIISALVKSENNRDKTLDLLVC